MLSVRSEDWLSHNIRNLQIGLLLSSSLCVVVVVVVVVALANLSIYLALESSFLLVNNTTQVTLNMAAKWSNGTKFSFDDATRMKQTT